ncbi:MAG: type II secretion system F family protein [Elusimicrobiota bacterium]
MAQFSYTAQDENGKIVAGQIEAVEELEATALVQSKGLLVLSIKQEQARQEPAQAQADGSNAKSKFFFNVKLDFLSAGVPAADLIFLAEQLALLIKGGVPLLQGLKILSENVTSPVLRRAIETVSEDISGGSSLSGALARHSKIFDDIWIAMVEAGEASGNLPKALEDISNYLNQRDILKTKIITAFMYPVILMCTSIGVLVFFIVKVVPIFAEIFKSFNMKLPALTVAVISFSNLIVNHLALLIGTVVVGGVLMKMYLRTEAGQWKKAGAILSLPAIGIFVRNVLTERFLINFSLLLKSGVDVIKSLLILEKLFSSNKIFLSAIVGAREKIKGGETIGASFSQLKAFPPLVHQMIRMGEESGKLPEILETLSQYYRRQVDTFIARLTSIIDPIMVLGVGAIVMVIVLAVFMPIFDLSQIGAGGGR